MPPEQDSAHPRKPPGFGPILAVVLAVILAIGCNAAYTTWWVSSSQAAQKRQGEIVERKICTTMGQLSALKPPPGNPAVNPSRAFDDQLHATLDRLGADLGCS